MIIGDILGHKNAKKECKIVKKVSKVVKKWARFDPKTLDLVRWCFGKMLSNVSIIIRLLYDGNEIKSD